ncbi:MAG: sigma-70 family RNA polymerase sigma factor [Candidatus Dadabacteria bacterium]|nr:MAG: sigma-70 family RNA polymerase sigma factor [Candidatus Dadabacteria bacterium]
MSRRPVKSAGKERPQGAAEAEHEAPREPRSGARPKTADPPLVEPEILEPEDVLWEEEEDSAGASLAHADEAREFLPAELPPATSTALVPRDALGAYLAEIRKYPILSREEEHELAVRYREHGDLEAAYKLVTSNLRLVVMIAREYQRAFHNLLDLIQEGNVGLLEAVRQFDPYRGVRFPSYAVWWIRAYIIRYVMNNFRLVKVGTTQAQRRLFFNLQKEKARLEAQGFKPTAKMIADRLGVKEKEVIEMDMRMGASEVSVDGPAKPDGTTPVIELLPYEGETAERQVADREFNELMRRKLEEFRASLKGRDLEIFDERLLAENPLTLQELGDRYGVSRERVRQIEESIKKRLREFLVEQIRDLPEAVGG